MLTRQSFLRLTAAMASPFSVPLLASASSQKADPLQSRRPPLAQRRFVSEGVEARIAEVKKAISDPELAWLFENCFPNTLDTTVRTARRDGKPDTFVITGDIDAMWLRDSTAQVWPYLPLAKEDRALRALLAGVINRQTRCILIDPYANAFNDGPTGSPWAKDRTRMRPELHERKWEIDSLCYPVRLAHGYWKTTGDASLFDGNWQNATALIVKTFREQQRLKDRGPYTFQRLTANPTDSLPQRGYGNPTRPCGLIHSGFRPSDDACIFPFLISANLFAVTALNQLEKIYTAELPNKSFARSAGNWPTRFARPSKLTGEPGGRRARFTPTRWTGSATSFSWTTPTFPTSCRCRISAAVRRTTRFTCELAPGFSATTTRISSAGLPRRAWAGHTRDST